MLLFILQNQDWPICYYNYPHFLFIKCPSQCLEKNHTQESFCFQYVCKHIDTNLVDEETETQRVVLNLYWGMCPQAFSLSLSVFCITSISEVFCCTCGPFLLHFLPFFLLNTGLNCISEATYSAEDQYCHEHTSFFSPELHRNTGTCITCQPQVYVTAFVPVHAPLSSLTISVAHPRPDIWLNFRTHPDSVYRCGKTKSSALKRRGAREFITAGMRLTKTNKWLTGFISRWCHNQFAISWSWQTLKSGPPYIMLIFIYRITIASFKERWLLDRTSMSLATHSLQALCTSDKEKEQFLSDSASWIASIEISWGLPFI